MRLLDLYCGAGGAAMGYYQAGFTEIVGVDRESIKIYPFNFVRGDAIDYLNKNWRNFDAIHASPPCQSYSAMTNIWKNSHKHPDLVAPTRDALKTTGLPYVIENVVGAPLRADLLLCGTGFGLPIIRHRIFESNVPMPLLTASCSHRNVYDPWHRNKNAQKFREAMEIDWMPIGGGGRKGTLDEAIPPAYTKFIGGILMQYLLSDIT